MSTSEAPHTPNSTPTSGFSAKFSHTLRSLEAAQKPSIGVPAYTRWVNRRVARYFAATAVALSITPNRVTAISAACSAAGLIVLITYPPSVGMGVCVALLFALGYGLDSADGQVARVTGASSPAGEWLDHVVDSIRVPSVCPPCTWQLCSPSCCTRRTTPSPDPAHSTAGSLRCP